MYLDKGNFYVMGFSCQTLCNFSKRSLSEDGTRPSRYSSF